LIVLTIIADGQTSEVDVKGKHSSEILQEFIKLTGATPAEEIIVERDPNSQ